MGRIRDLVKRNRTLSPPTEAGPSTPSIAVETPASPPELCSACSQISTYHNVEHWSPGALMSSGLNGCPCCKLIYKRLKELTPVPRRHQEDPVDQSQLTVIDSLSSRSFWQEVSPQKLGSGRSKILLDGLSSGIIFKVTEWPGVGDHNGSFEFFRRRGSWH